MPIYEFECPVHGIITKYMSIADMEWTTRTFGGGTLCQIQDKDGLHCDIVAPKIWSVPGNIQIGSPTKMFVNNRTGEVYAPSTRYDKPPNGYHEIELKNPIERSKFEKEQQRKADAENQLTSHVLDSMKSQARKNRHDNLKSRMTAIQREEVTNLEGKKETVEFTLDHKDQQLLTKAMERSNKKPRKEKKTEVKLAINHYNPSNMDQIK